MQSFCKKFRIEKASHEAKFWRDTYLNINSYVYMCIAKIRPKFFQGFILTVSTMKISAPTLAAAIVLGCIAHHNIICKAFQLGNLSVHRISSLQNNNHRHNYSPLTLQKKNWSQDGQPTFLPISDHPMAISKITNQLLFISPSYGHFIATTTLWPKVQ